MAVDYSKLRAMASKMVDPIDWPLPLTIRRTVKPELHVLHGANKGNKSKDLLQSLGHERATIGIPG